MVSEVSARISDGRIRRVHLAIRGIAGKIGRQLAARGIDGRLHVACGGIDVAAEIELQNDAGGTQLAGRSHLVHARDASELPLQRSRHRRGHRLRACSRQARAHRDDGELHLRQWSDGEKVECQRSRKQQRRRQQRRPDRPLDEWSGNIHDFSLRWPREPAPPSDCRSGSARTFAPDGQTTDTRPEWCRASATGSRAVRRQS